MAVGSLGMLSTSNYVARRFGVRAAMPGSRQLLLKLVSIVVMRRLILRAILARPWC
jgi:nucleotidyltransferase/DNA polymerase involved in DNA repair